VPPAVRQDGPVTFDTTGSASPETNPTDPAPDPALLAELGAVAADLARDAGALVRDGRPRQVDVAATKSSAVDVVTAMDLASEALIRRTLAQRRPHDGILGEEEGLVAGTSGVTWVVDPIDGTVNYLYGLPAYAVSIAAVVGEPTPETWTVVAAAVHSVADGRTWTATLGGGAFEDGRRLHVNAPAPLAQSLVATGFGYTVERRRGQARVVAEVLPRVRDIRRGGSAAIDLCHVASGAVDLFYERGLQPWDLAAASLVAREAGAAVLGLHGRPAATAMTVAGPEPTARELVALLEELGADSDTPAA
jgi:myo-inositol-1(or 4)-monophosphatase